MDVHAEVHLFEGGIQLIHVAFLSIRGPARGVGVIQVVRRSVLRKQSRVRDVPLERRSKLFYGPFL